MTTTGRRLVQTQAAWRFVIGIILVIIEALTIAAAFVEHSSTSRGTISSTRLSGPTFVSWLSRRSHPFISSSSPQTWFFFGKKLHWTGCCNQKEPMNVALEEVGNSTVAATVARLAVRPYDANASKPSSRHYTTRKESVDHMVVSLEGAHQDYNHYRSTVLNNTPDRALSLLTSDAMKIVRQQYPACRDGDLGENILLHQGEDDDELSFHAMGVGKKYIFLPNDDQSKKRTEDDISTSSNPPVRIEITEPVVPCANLCKLPFINDPNRLAKDNVAACLEFINFLGQKDGQRGWYAKVIQPGVLHVGYAMTLVVRAAFNASAEM